MKRLIWLLVSLFILAGCAPAPTPPPVQRLRLTNQSIITLHNLVIIFPEERVSLGSLAAGATSEYFIFEKGVYRYAAYNVEINGRRYSQPVVDWMGESPMSGQDFTYIVRADPTQWETKNQVIELLQVVAEP